MSFQIYFLLQKAYFHQNSFFRIFVFSSYPKDMSMCRYDSRNTYANNIRPSCEGSRRLIRCLNVVRKFSHVKFFLLATPVYEKERSDEQRSVDGNAYYIYGSAKFTNLLPGCLNPNYLNTSTNTNHTQSERQQLAAKPQQAISRALDLD